jgi:hypothetical protein
MSRISPPVRTRPGAIRHHYADPLVIEISASEHTGDESAHVVTAELLADASNDLRAGGITRFVP